MNAHILPAADAATRSPLPGVPVIESAARLVDRLKGILFWAIFGFGLGFPLFAVGYALMKY